MKNNFSIEDAVAAAGAAADSADVRAINPIVSRPLTESEHREKLEMMQRLSALDFMVQEAIATKTQWLEIEDDTLSHLCGGDLPEAHYMWYKNVRLCRIGMAAEIAAKEGESIYEVLFKKDGITYAKRV